MEGYFDAPLMNGQLKAPGLPASARPSMNGQLKTPRLPVSARPSMNGQLKAPGLPVFTRPSMNGQLKTPGLPAHRWVVEWHRSSPQVQQNRFRQIWRKRSRLSAATSKDHQLIVFLYIIPE